MDEFQNRMEIIYTIYAPVFLEGVSTTEYYSEAYIVVHGYTPSMTITDGEGFLFVKELHFSGASSTTSGGEGFLTANSHLLTIAVTETTGDGLLEAVFAVSLPSVSTTESVSEGYVLLQHNLSGPSKTASGGVSELTVNKVHFRGYSVTVTAGDAFMTPRYIWTQGISTTDVVGEGRITPRYIWTQGISTTDVVGEGRITPRYVWTGGTSATETDGIGRLFANVFFGGTSTTESDGQGGFETSYPVNVTGWLETSSGGDGNLSVLVIMRGTSPTWTYGYGFLHTAVYLGPGLEEPIPPSITETAGFGRFIAPYPRPMDGGSLTVTDGKGRITEAEFLVGTSATETDGTGEPSILCALMGTSATETDGTGEPSILCALMGMSVTLTDSGGRITKTEFLVGTSATESYGAGELLILYKLDLYKPDLMKYLPAYYEKSKIMKSIQNAYSTELGYVYFFLEDFLKQFLTPATATWGLAFWEQELGLKTDTSKTLEERREIILARLQGIGTVTKDVIKRIAEAFSGGEVEVIEYPAEHRFVVRFVGTIGVPKNIASFIEIIEDLKPAHLVYSFEYTFAQWDWLKELTWAEAGTMTWNQLKEYKRRGI